MTPSSRRRLAIGAVCLFLYVLVLLVLVQDLGFDTPLPSLRNLYGVAALVRVTTTLLLQAVAFVPLGFIAALALEPREGRLDRLLRVWLPALALTLTLGAMLVALDLGSFSLVQTVLPSMGGFLGVAMGAAWGRGARARRRFFVEVAVLGAIAVVGLAMAVTRAVESAPLSFEPTVVNSGERRSVYRQFEGKSPQAIPEGKTERLALSPRDLNVLLAWGLSLEHTGRKVQVEVDDDNASLAASARLPGESRYLNAVLAGSAGIENGRLRLHVKQLSVGRLDAPSWLLAAVSPAIARMVVSDPRVKVIVAPIRKLDLTRTGVEIVYGHADLPNGFVASLFQGEGTGEGDVPIVRAHVRHLLDVAGSLPRDEARFGAAVEAAFDYARLRSKNGNAVKENRGAVLALGILLGHWRVQNLVGTVLDEGRLKLATRAYKGVDLRGRTDWPKHFFVSASLTVVSHRAVSDQTGLLKEELDADGGSGFSFGDLAADRAGTTFGQAATRDEAAARAMQDRLDRGFRVDDFFPLAADLPEDLTDAEFQARYGGVGGAGYERVVEEIEKRVSRCAAYRDEPLAGAREPAPPGR